MDLRNNLKKGLAFITTFIIANALSLAAFAQPVDPGDGDCGTSPDDACQVPLDTWVIVLVAAGLIYGIYHLNKKQKALCA
ncbi:PID-CTERM protein-sorting domain-containing protein [Mucilaginibacter terrenus]|nr:hypothetical protein [Mucilaginibacter terrenus]